MIETIISVVDFCWFWFGRVIGGLLFAGCCLAVICAICEYCHDKLVNIKLFIEFLKWKRDNK